MKTMGDVIRSMNNEELGVQLGDILLGGVLGAMESLGIQTSEEEKEALRKHAHEMMIEEVNKVVEDDNHE